jgi:hypothetical protein
LSAITSAYSKALTGKRRIQLSPILVALTYLLQIVPVFLLPLSCGRYVNAYSSSVNCAALLAPLVGNFVENSERIPTQHRDRLSVSLGSSGFLEGLTVFVCSFVCAVVRWARHDSRSLCLTTRDSVVENGLPSTRHHSTPLVLSPLLAGLPCN